ncbi:LysR family transcriptional regulator [Streptomyces sp. NPDC057438]|uniref:helix-turn-helix domain-containing protein n=1 Tax=Streptomyces sp. NPDC057438 TaxID=3346133 RepID=UPI0036B125C8
MGPALNASSQLRYRTATPFPRLPRHTPEQIRARARSVPAQFWTEPALRLSSRHSPRAGVLRPGLAGLLLMAGTQTKPAVLVQLLGSATSAKSMSYVLTRLGADPSWPDIQTLIARLADHLDDHPAPIDYERRRHLDYTGLLPARAWRDICRRCDTEPGKKERHLIAQSRLFEQLSGMPADQAQTGFATRTPMDRTRLALFTATLTPEQAAALDTAGADFLARHHIPDEPVSWQPPCSLYDGLRLPGVDPAAFDIHQLHQLLRAVPYPALSEIADRLDISLDAARHLLELHPAPRPPAARGTWTSAHGALRADLRDRLPEAEFRRLYATMSLDGIAEQHGAGRHLIAALADDYGIRRRPPTERLRREIDPAWLYDQYVLNRRTIGELAAQVGMSENGLRARARSYGIPIRRKGGPSHVKALRAANEVDTAPELLRPALTSPQARQWLIRFAAAARYPTLRDAADDLGINPATLYSQVRRLTRDLGGPLLTRAYRDHPMRLTALGAAVVDAIAELNAQD